MLEFANMHPKILRWDKLIFPHVQNLEGGPSVILGDFYPGIDLCSDGESVANLSNPPQVWIGISEVLQVY